jgi:hypothetical protein
MGKCRKSEAIPVLILNSPLVSSVPDLGPIIVTWDDGFLGQRAAAGAALAGDLRLLRFQQEEREQ